MFKTPRGGFLQGEGAGLLKLFAEFSRDRISQTSAIATHSAKTFPTDE